MSYIIKKIKEIIKQTFYRGDKFFPPFAYLYLMLCLVTVSVVMYLMTQPVTETLVISLCGFVSVWMALIITEKKMR